jgi:predicted nucleic acid-binding protein
MTALVDTPIWSLALRRDPGDLSTDQRALRGELAELIGEGRARLLGPIRQEILSGIREESQFQRLREHLRAFPDEPLAPEDYEEAARFNNQCRRVGIVGSAIDFLICAAAMRRKWAIFTTDRDFGRYSKHLPIRLHKSWPLKQ